VKSSIASDVNIDINLIWEMEGGDYVFRRLRASRSLSVTGRPKLTTTWLRVSSEPWS
jgi:hypothetical protein